MGLKDETGTFGLFLLWVMLCLVTIFVTLLITTLIQSPPQNDMAGKRAERKQILLVILSVLSMLALPAVCMPIDSGGVGFLRKLLLFYTLFELIFFPIVIGTIISRINYRIFVKKNLQPSLKNFFVIALLCTTLVPFFMCYMLIIRDAQAIF
jgi:cytochrome bd-type quinol oxidase subunit 2